MAAQRVAVNTRRLFRKLAAGIFERAVPSKPAPKQKPPVRRSILDSLHAPCPYDPEEEERAYAEHVLREWSREDEQQHDDSFHYAPAVGFDHHP